MSGSHPAVEFIEVSRSFGSVLANDSISFSVNPGEIHAVVGENGAGKSTLMGILSGFLRPDSGAIRVNGAPLRCGSPAAAIAAGVGLCAQHFHLVPGLTGMENILLGARRGLAASGPGEMVAVTDLMDRFGLPTDLDRRVSELSVGERERVEILKLLHRGSRILILDEPTAVLAPAEVELLFGVLRRLAADGCAILFVSHKLPEVMALADRVTVLRGGRLVGTEVVAGTEPSRLVSMIVGGAKLPDLVWTPSHAGDVVLEVERLDAGSGGVRINELSFSVRSGEIVGVGGVEGNGQKELVGALLGTVPIASGEIRFLGRTIDPRRPSQFRRRIGCIPADRSHEGLLPDIDLVENMALGRQGDVEFRRWIFLNRDALVKAAGEVVQRFGVRPARLDLPGRALSGGNQQRFIAGREISRKPPLLLAVHPTRGVDLLATSFLHGQILAERDRGAAVLLVSADLGELQALSDRILILYRGLPAYEALRADVKPDELHASLLGLGGEGR